jgi:hypothetical protein
LFGLAQHEGGSLKEPHQLGSSDGKEGVDSQNWQIPRLTGQTDLAYSSPSRFRFFDPGWFKNRLLKVYDFSGLYTWRLRLIEGYSNRIKHICNNFLLFKLISFPNPNSFLLGSLRRSRTF